MAISITVNGIDRTSQSHFQSLTVLNTITAKADTADLTFTTTGSWRPMAGNSVYVVNGNSTEFGGVAMEVVEEQPNPSQFRYLVNCRDFVYLLDRTLVVNNYASTMASTIVKDIVANNTSGFTSSGVQASGNVAAQTFDYTTVSDAIQSMADTLGWAWGVTYDRDVKFYSAAANVAPLATINLDSATTEIGPCVITESVQQLKNSAYMKGFGVKGTATFTQILKGDGNRTVFDIGYEPGSTAAADIAVTRAPAGSTAITETINLDNVDGQAGDGVGAADDVFVNYSAKNLRWSIAPGSSDTITVTMTTLRETPVNVQDTVSQSTMAAREGGSGVHEFVLNDPGLQANDGTDAVAVDRGNLALIRYAYPRFQAKFTSYTQGWKAGQSLVMSSTKRWGGGFSKTMYVSQVRKKLVNHPGTGGTPLLSYDIEVSDQGLAL